MSRLSVRLSGEFGLLFRGRTFLTILAAEIYILAFVRSIEGFQQADYEHIVFLLFNVVPWVPVAMITVIDMVVQDLESQSFWVLRGATNIMPLYLGRIGLICATILVLITVSDMAIWYSLRPFGITVVLFRTLVALSAGVSVAFFSAVWLGGRINSLLASVILSAPLAPFVVADWYRNSRPKTVSFLVLTSLASVVFMLLGSRVIRERELGMR